MIFNGEGLAHETPVYDGALLGAGDRITGPAVIQEVTTTIVIEPGWMAELDASAVYVVTQVAEQTAPQTRRAVEVA